MALIKGDVLKCADRTLDLTRPHIMGVLNVTPDSFSDGGHFISPDIALRHAENLVAHGADIIDVGGESTRPGALPVPVSEELDRVMPILERLRVNVDAVISIDTSKPEVMTAAQRAGVHMINDVMALQRPGALNAAARGTTAVCLMHMSGEPRTMQHTPIYDNVVTEVHAFLESRMQACFAAGIEMDRICLDPGFGFGKTLEHNLQLLRSLAAFLDLKCPLLVGLSRKSMIGKLLGRTEVSQRLYGSISLAGLAVWLGASIVRCHDVAETRDAVTVIAAVRDGGSDVSFS